MRFSGGSEADSEADARISMLKSDLASATALLMHERDRVGASEVGGEGVVPVARGRSKRSGGGSHRKLLQEALKTHERLLRCESSRKALIYQKRYLLLLISNFQSSEEAAVVDIASRGIAA
jgi:hypothetical protein